MACQLPVIENQPGTRTTSQSASSYRSTGKFYQSFGHVLSDSSSTYLGNCRIALTPLGRPYELVLVNDCSPDESEATLNALAKEHPELRPIHLRKNAGQHNALLCRIRHANYPIVVTMDDDLQHPPSEIPKLLAASKRTLTLSTAHRTKTPEGGLETSQVRSRSFGLRVTLGVQIADYVSSFRVFRTNLREAFSEFRSPFVAIDVLLSWGAQRYAHVPVEHHARAEGTSNYSIPKLVRHALNLITGFSVVPLQIASLLGLAAATFWPCESHFSWSHGIFSLGSKFKVLRSLRRASQFSRVLSYSVWELSESTYRAHTLELSIVPNM